MINRIIQKLISVYRVVFPKPEIIPPVVFVASVPLPRIRLQQIAQDHPIAVAGSSLEIQALVILYAWVTETGIGRCRRTTMPNGSHLWEFTSKKDASFFKLTWA